MTKDVVNTLTNHILEPNTLTEITVTDFTHPLYGQTFSLATPHQNLHHHSNFVVVNFHTAKNIIHRKNIPVSATNLIPQITPSNTKISVSALKELISLAKECNLLCPNHHEQSGE